MAKPSAFPNVLLLLVLPWVIDGKAIRQQDNASTASIARLASAIRNMDEGRGGNEYNYTAYLESFGHPSNRGGGGGGGGEGGEDHVARSSLFEDRFAKVKAHNGRWPSPSWSAVVNQFADLTDRERRGHLGYRRTHASGTSSGLRASTRGMFGASTAWLRTALEPVFASSALGAKKKKSSRLAQAIDYRSKLRSSRYVRDQGQCGSCWAVAAVGALEMHLELAVNDTAYIDYNELVDCMPNPRMCGGSGGCGGATAELAFEYVQKSGIRLVNSSDSSCLMSSPGNGRAIVHGYVKLPTNQGVPLLEALATSGPVVVSVSAGDWFGYGGGVFDACLRDTVVDHAVLATGYGIDGKTSLHYWLIRNSWGQTWGEDGHIRLLRHTRDDEYCGMDTRASEGTACSGDPEEVSVCGMCGVLADSSYPTGVRVLEEQEPPNAVGVQVHQQLNFLHRQGGAHESNGAHNRG